MRAPMTSDAAAAHAGQPARARLLLRLAAVLAVLGVVSHYLPVPASPRNLVAAIVLVWLTGLAVVAWLPRQRLDLCVSIVVAGGLAVNVVVTTTLLIVDWYTPDRAAMLAGLLALAALWGRTRVGEGQ